MTDTVRRRAKLGRPKGSGAHDPDVEIDRLIVKRRDAQDENREAALAKSRRALREYKERGERREQWVDYHTRLGRQYQHLADEHYSVAAQLRREIA